MEPARPGGRLGPVLTEDICVPRSRVPEMLAQVERIGAAHGVQIATIAHAGDGNLHPLLVTPPGDDGARIAAQAAFEQLLDAAIALGGTVTGEHGVGILKRGASSTPEPWRCRTRCAARWTRSSCSIRARREHAAGDGREHRPGPAGAGYASETAPPASA